MFDIDNDLIGLIYIFKNIIIYDFYIKAIA